MTDYLGSIGSPMKCSSIGYLLYGYLVIGDYPYKINGSLKDFSLSMNQSGGGNYNMKDFWELPIGITINPSTLTWSSFEYGSKNFTINASCAWRFNTYFGDEPEFAVTDTGGNVLIQDYGSLDNIWGGNGTLTVNRNTTPGIYNGTITLNYSLPGGGFHTAQCYVKSTG